MKKIVFSLILAIFFTSAQAAEPVNFTVGAESSIKFKTQYEDDVVEGKFNHFSGDISFHPQALDRSRAFIRIEIPSMESGYANAIDTLKTEGWFNPEEFPQAVFESSSFKALGDNKYEADGFLTIKSAKQPIKLNFTLDRFDEKSAVVNGTAMLKRSSFQLGWEETDELKDEVEISFRVIASAKN